MLESKDLRPPVVAWRHGVGLHCNCRDADQRGKTESVEHRAFHYLVLF